MQIEKVYEPQRFEPHWAQWWIDSNIFRASPENPGRVFSLVIPPPNLTGALQRSSGLPQQTSVLVTAATVRLTQVSQSLVVEPRATSRYDDVTQTTSASARRSSCSG